MSKTFAGNFFEDFELGDILVHGTPRTITEGDVSLYIALTGSRFELHCANTVAKACGFPETPIDNVLLFHIAFGKTVPEISLNAVANLGYAECKFLTPSYVGDTVSVTSKVIGLKENSNGKTGVVYVHSIAKNQHEQTLVEWKRWVMVHKQQPGLATGLDTTPNLSPTVSDTDSLIPSGFTLNGFNTDWTASTFRYHDYEAGEVIDHVDGMTINDSDHSLATRLYQNNAKVHFDAHAMKSSRHEQRLVYGGHIISLCRALSHNGLANGMWLAAINGGTHCNPSFAGDTIYSQSQVVDKGEVRGRDDLGWIRVKTFGLKNNSALTFDQFTSNENGKMRYHSDIVLELDYTLLIAK